MTINLLFINLSVASLLTSIIVDTKNEKIVVNSQDSFFCLRPKVSVYQLQLETFRYKKKEIMVVPDNFFVFSIQDDWCLKIRYQKFIQLFCVVLLLSFFIKQGRLSQSSLGLPPSPVPRQHSLWTAPCLLVDIIW